MNKPLRVLIVEDSADDTELLLSELKRGGYDPTYERVETSSAMEIMLKKQEWDVVLAAHSLPFFSGIGALTELQIRGLDLPIIIVSDVNGEDMAAAAIKAGAHDYVIKNNLKRLVPAIERELKKIEERRRCKRIEEELRETKKQLEHLLRTGQVIFFTAKTSGDYGITFISDNITLQLGYTLQEVLKDSRFWIDHIHPEDLPRVLDELPHLFETGYTVQEYRFLSIDGTYRWIRSESKLMKDDAGNPLEITGYWVDITKSKRKEEEKAKLREQRLHAQRLESLDKLAEGIAHNFNNILSAVIGYGELLRKEVKKENSSKEYVQRILESAERATKLTQDLLMFSRRRISNPKPVNLNAIIKWTEHLLSRLIPENIKLKITLTDKDYIVMADSSQIEQVLINLTTNAIDAMPDGGTLTISTEIVELDNTFIKTYGYGKIGTYVLVSISDTGIGMDDDTKKRIFEPFFTTKKREKSVGLGLAIVYGIVKEHQGYINFDSALGKGTTFKIYLPIIESKIKERVSEELPTPKGGIKSILVTKDEETTGKLSKQYSKDLV